MLAKAQVGVGGLGLDGWGGLPVVIDRPACFDTTLSQQVGAIEKDRLADHPCRNDIHGRTRTYTHTCTQAVAFDVDSTVCAEEGIDVLADFLGQGEAVAELTAK